MLSANVSHSTLSIRPVSGDHQKLHKALDYSRTNIVQFENDWLMR